MNLLLSWEWVVITTVFTYLVCEIMYLWMKKEGWYYYEEFLTYRHKVPLLSYQ